MTASVLDLVMRKVRFSIPKEILDVTFNPTSKGMSLEGVIQSEVIEDMLLPEINSISGSSMRIPLNPRWLIPTELLPVGLSMMSREAEFYKIPPEARANQDLVSVRRIYTSSAMTGDFLHLGVEYSGKGNNLANAMEMTLNSRTYEDDPTRPTAVLKAGNIIMIKPRIYSHNFIIECTVGFDIDFTNAPDAMRPALVNYIVLGIKRSIFINSDISIDAGRVHGGYEIGKFREHITRYGEEASDEALKTALHALIGARILSNGDDLDKYLYLSV